MSPPSLSAQHPWLTQRSPDQTLWRKSFGGGQLKGRALTLEFFCSSFSWQQLQPQCKQALVSSQVSRSQFSSLLKSINTCFKAISLSNLKTWQCSKFAIFQTAKVTSECTWWAQACNLSSIPIVSTHPLTPPLCNPSIRTWWEAMGQQRQGRGAATLTTAHDP